MQVSNITTNFKDSKENNFNKQATAKDKQNRKTPEKEKINNKVFA